MDNLFRCSRSGEVWARIAEIGGLVGEYSGFTVVENLVRLRRNVRSRI